MKKHTIKKKSNLLRAIVGRCLTNREIVLQIMFLAGVEAMPQKKFNAAVRLIARKWSDGFKIGQSFERDKPRMIEEVRKILAPVPGSRSDSEHVGHSLMIPMTPKLLTVGELKRQLAALKVPDDATLKSAYGDNNWLWLSQMSFCQTTQEINLW